jgi:biotin synthase
VPINQLVAIPGTPLADAAPVDPFDFVRAIALARILMPRSHVRLSAGRSDMSDEMQALCFLAGANSLFCGDRLLTTGNPGVDHDQQLFQRLGLRGEACADVTGDRAVTPAGAVAVKASPGGCGCGGGGGCATAVNA